MGVSRLGEMYRGMNHEVFCKLSFINELRGVANQSLAKNRSPETCIKQATSGGAGDSGGARLKSAENGSLLRSTRRSQRQEEILSNGVLEHESNQELLMHKFPFRELRVLGGDSLSILSPSGTG
jgi:hypothetical protein